jgi:hypothetical protein
MFEKSAALRNAQKGDSMNDYSGLLEGYWATRNTVLGQILTWLNEVSPGHPDLKGAGNYVDAWRHGGTAALLAYHHGYDNVIRWGNALEQWHPDNEQEAAQDYWNNDVGARIGSLARITGMTVDELGDALKAAFQDGVFQTNAYARFARVPFFKVGQMIVSPNTGWVTLPDGSQFDFMNSEIHSVDGKDYPVLSVLLKNGTIKNLWTNMEDARTLFRHGIGKWNSESPSVAGSVDSAPPASFNDRFGSWIPSPPISTAFDAQPQPGSSTQTDPRNIRVLDRIVLPNAGSVGSAPQPSIPGVPFVPTNDVLSQGRPASFNDRFGNWTSPSPVAVPPGSQSQSNNATQVEPSDIRVLHRFIRAPDGNLVPAPLGGPNQPQTGPQSDRPLGPLSGQPMPNYPVLSPILGFQDRSTTSGDDIDDWFARRIKPLMLQ